MSLFRSELAPAPPPNDNFEAPPPPIDDEAAPAPPPETDEEVVAAVPSLYSSVAHHCQSLLCLPSIIIGGGEYING